MPGGFSSCLLHYILLTALYFHSQESSEAHSLSAIYNKAKRCSTTAKWAQKAWQGGAGTHITYSSGSFHMLLDLKNSRRQVLHTVSITAAALCCCQLTSPWGATAINMWSEGMFPMEKNKFQARTGVCSQFCVFKAFD